MQVIKRDKRTERVRLDKLTRRIGAQCSGLDMNYVHPSVIASHAISILYPGVTTAELEILIADIAASMINQHPDFAILAARIAISHLHKETKKHFSDVIADLYHEQNSIARLHRIDEKYYTIVKNNADKLNAAIVHDRDFNYSYTTFKTLKSKHLLKINEKVVERPQYMLMRVAVCIHGEDIDKAIETYNHLSKQYYIHTSQTVDNACTVNQKMSSSYLLTMSEDSIDGITDTLERAANLCHSNGDIGFNVHCIRAKNTPIRGTGGVSNGLIPMLRVYNTSLRAISNNGESERSITVYLEPWHTDIFEFLELKRNIGEEQLRAKDMFYALWIPDLFMKRVFDDEVWSLMCPHQCPGLTETWGDEFNTLYIRYEKEKRYRKQVQARELWLLITQLQIETGTPYIVYKDHCNRKSNHQNLGTIKCSSFSTEIVHYSSSNEVATCNTAAIAVDAFVDSVTRTYDFDKLKTVVKTVTYNLDKMIDVSLYPLEEATLSNRKHRSIGIGVQGLADVFILMRYTFESPEAKELNVKIFETLYYGALEASCEMAIESGSYETYESSPVSKGILQFDMWNVKPTNLWDWDVIKTKIVKHGMRNSLLIAQMSDAFMAQMLENNQSIEPYTSNIYTMHVMSKQFSVVKNHLMRDLIKRGLWDNDMCEQIIANGGFIQNIDDIPEDLKAMYKTAWEMPQKTIFEMAAARGPFIDQSQSFNVHMIDPLDKLTSMHFYAWEIGLKSSMYHLKTEKFSDYIQKKMVKLDIVDDKIKLLKTV